MNQEEFKRRTKSLALSTIVLTDALPVGRVSEVIGRQLLRSATSVGANYRARCRARSPQEMFAKLSIVEEESDECLYWLELLVESGLCRAETVDTLVRQTGEILAMTVASKKTLRLKIAGTSRQQSTIDNRQSSIGAVE